ncbi:TniQ family protein [Alicyclobacillus curvatus]|nr:TniQ family protein [Alicyclobacillus curvatus]
MLKLLLNRPTPHQGESMFSFLLRIAQANEISLVSLLNFHRRNASYIQRADLKLLDINPASVTDMWKICEMTGRSEDRLLQLTMVRGLSILAHNDNLARTRFMSGAVRDTVHYCPLCIRQDPVFQLIWRFEGLNVCIKHAKCLRTACACCGEAIKYCDVETVGLCPYCKSPMGDGIPGDNPENKTEIAQQTWLYRVWDELMSTETEVNIEPQKVAMKLLYISSGFSHTFDRNGVSGTLNRSTLQALLQQARGSLHQLRTLHITFLLNFLYAHESSFSTFVELEVPDEFVRSVISEARPLVERLSCRAPWCAGYENPGTLVKTGTTVKKMSSGARLLYYTFCTTCGCEYAITEEGAMQERTYFISFFEHRSLEHSTDGMNKRHVTGYTTDKINRCNAYFSTRTQHLTFSCQGVTIVPLVLDKVISAIKAGARLKAIAKWSMWRTQNEFLAYRFHISTMRTLHDVCRPRIHTHAVKTGPQEVQAVLNALLEKNLDITLGTICRIIGVCPETIRAWGCNADVAQAKEQQRRQRTENRIEEIYRLVEVYFQQHDMRIVKASELYRYLGQSRTLIWRMDPQITANIDFQIRSHNRLVM